VNGKFYGISEEGINMKNSAEVQKQNCLNFILGNIEIKKTILQLVNCIICVRLQKNYQVSQGIKFQEPRFLLLWEIQREFRVVVVGPSSYFMWI
jgi:hypothetical protein